MEWRQVSDMVRISAGPNEVLLDGSRFHIGRETLMGEGDTNDWSFAVVDRTALVVPFVVTSSVEDFSSLPSSSKSSKSSKGFVNNPGPAFLTV